MNGWPDKSKVTELVKPFYTIAAEISIKEGLLLHGSRIIIPASLKKTVLQQIHTGHQGIRKCRDRAKQSVWWPGLSCQLEDVVNNCETCRQHLVQHTEPLIPTELPQLPWQKVGMDLFDYQGSTYLLIVDYYSRYIEIAKLNRLTAEEVIKQCKSIFARHGIPETVMSDNGPQFSAEVFEEFAHTYNFELTTSSPYYPRSNGEAERAVKTIKDLLKKGGDPYLSLLSYRVTPLSNGYSPSELLMNRRLRSNVPSTRELREPTIPDRQKIAVKERKQRVDQKRNHDHHHGSRELPELVWIPDREEDAQVREQVAPRPYEVETNRNGVYRRNRRDIVSLPSPQECESTNHSEEMEQTEQPSRRSTRVTARPDRCDPTCQ